MQIVLGEALVAPLLFLCKVVDKSARFLSREVRAAPFLMTPVVAKVLMLFSSFSVIVLVWFQKNASL